MDTRPRLITGVFVYTDLPPDANAGSDQLANDTDGNGLETVTLDGSGSSDSNGTIVTYTWTEAGNPIATNVNPEVSLTVGPHSITLTVTDDDGATDTDDVVVIING